MGTTEQQTEAVLAILAAADGPLLASQVRGRIVALGYHWPFSVGVCLWQLVGRGLAESMSPPGGGARERIYWPTTLGRAEADSLEDARIEEA